MKITSYDLKIMDPARRTMLINSVSGFKSLQMVGTSCADGISNLALFNSIFHVGANPPLLGMVVRPDGPEHSTLKNIKFNGQYTLNNVLPQWYEKAHQTSARYAVNESEFEQCGFNRTYIEGFKAPFVSESTIKIGMEVRDITKVSINNTTIVIGEIICLILDNEIIGTDGFADIEMAGSVTVAGLDSYHTTQRLDRLAYAQPGKYSEAINVNNKGLDTTKLY